MATNASDLASKAGQAPSAQMTAQMPPPANPADDDGADYAPSPTQSQPDQQNLKIADDDDGEGGMLDVPDYIKQAWAEIKPEDAEAINQAGKEVSKAVDEADEASGEQPATPSARPADSLSYGERVLLQRGGYSAEDLDSIAGMTAAQRGIILRSLERAPAPSAQPQQYGPNPYMQQQPSYGPPQYQQTQQGGLPGYPMQGQPQYQPQQGYQPQQPQYGYQQQGYSQPQSIDADLARVANEMGVDVNTARQFLQLSSSQHQQALQQRDQQLMQMQQELAYIRQQSEQQQVDSAMSAAHSALAQRYPQLQDRNAFMNYAMQPHTAALANSYRQQGLSLHEAVAAAVETMAAPSFMQQAGHNQQRQLHQAAMRSRQTAERLPPVNRASSMPALPKGQAGVDALWDQPQLRAAMGA